jgi:hypothetical protein
MENDGITVYLTTEKQRDMDYIIEIKGILDLSGNEVKGGTRKFRGSTSSDPISPSLLSLSLEPGNTGLNPDTVMIFTFSETMDTASVREALVLLPLREGDPEIRDPELDSGQGSGHDLSLQWSPSLSMVQIGVKDGYQEEVVNRVYVTKGCRDYSGNSLKSSSSTYFTVDDSLPGGSISGRVVLPGETSMPESDTQYVPMTLIGLLDEERNLLLLEVVQEQEDGEFQLTALSFGTYILIGWREEGEAILSGDYGPINIESIEPVENVPLFLKPDVGEGPASVLKKYYSLLD